MGEKGIRQREIKCQMMFSFELEIVDFLTSYVRTCVMALRGIFFPPDPLSQLGNREEEGDVTIGED